MSIKHLWESCGIPGVTQVSDLVQICQRDPDYKKFGSNEDELKKFSLLQPGGGVHDSIRNIVLSAFTGKGLELELHSPLAE